MKQVPRVYDRMILRVDHLIYDSGHFDTVLLLELAEVLEAHAIVIILDVVIALFHLLKSSLPCPLL